VLEYGHTVGHALEVTMNGALTHGLAIGIGMVVAAEVAHLLGVGGVRVEEALFDLLGRLGAPTEIPACADPGELMARIRRDNKRGYLEHVVGAQDMVLLEDLGRPIATNGKPLTRVPEEVVRRAISARTARRTPQVTSIRTSVGARARRLVVSITEERSG